jgi:HEAT repeat protein
VNKASFPAAQDPSDSQDAAIQPPNETETALEALSVQLAQIGDASPEVVAQLTQALDQAFTCYLAPQEALKPQAVLTLLQVMEHAPQISLVQRAVHWVNRLKIQSAVPCLCRLLEGGATIPALHVASCPPHQAFLTKRMAVQTLGVLRNPLSLNTLIKLLSNQAEDYRLRLAAAEALGRLGDASAASVLLEVASNPAEPSQYVRESSIKSLGLLKDLEAIGHLVDKVFGIFQASERLSFLKETLIQAIGHLDGDALRHQQPQKQKIEATLLDHLEDPVVAIRVAAIESLTAINALSALPILKERLVSETPEVAMAIVHALEEFEAWDFLHQVADEKAEELPKLVVEAIRTALAERPLE